jgi:hypothetical protein
LTFNQDVEMKKKLFSSLSVFFLGASAVFAQPSPMTIPIRDDDVPKTKAVLGPPTLPPGYAVASEPTPILGSPAIPKTDGPAVKGTPTPIAVPDAYPADHNDYWTGNCCPATRFWASAEYLLWRVTSAPVRVPLITGNNNPATIAALNEPGTVILFGAGSGQGNNFGLFSGGRVSVGGWFDSDQTFGFEASGFLLEDRSILFRAASAGGTAPIVSIPFNATTPFNNNPFPPPAFFNPAGPTTFNSGGAPNVVTARLESRLWGAEANGVANIFSSDRVHFTGLLGFRYIDLFETLSLTDASFQPATNGVLSVSDSFNARNQFYGGQLGAKAGINFGRWNLDTSLQVALGSNHESLNVGGNTTITNNAFGFASGVAPGGVFAQTTNIGTYERNVFAVVPEARLKLGYQITPRIQTFVGFNYLYMSDVLRPGNQINSNTQAANFVPPGTGGLPGPTNLHSSSFSAYGVNFGVQFSF